MSSRTPERRRGLCMATAEDRRVRLQGYVDARSLDRRQRAERGRAGRVAHLLDRLRATLPLTAHRSTSRRAGKR